MVTVTITRTVKAENAFGLGARISEGTIAAQWGSARTIKAGSLGLRTITNLVVSAGTPLNIDVAARVISAGSRYNTARVHSYLKQSATQKLGTMRYIVYPVAFIGTPQLIIGPGSVGTKVAPGSPEVMLKTQRPGSFQIRASPSLSNASYFAVGPGSYALNFIAIGE